MSPTVYYVLHLSSLFLLFGYTFYAFAAPAETRKRVMALTGVASLLVIVSGFGLIAKIYGNNFQGWMIVKMVAWLGISGLAGLGYRKRGKVGVFALSAVILAIVAVVMVYTKPF